MAENDSSSLFRKSSLERISSPDKLNDYIKVTNPSLVILLVGIFTILIAGIVWIFSGVIPKTVELTGMVATDVRGKEGVYCFVPLSTSKRLSEGMDVQISPDYADREQYGYIKGKVESVGSSIITTEYLSGNFSNPQIFYSLLSSGTSGNLVEVELSMNEWSSDEGDKPEITEGTICNISAITGGTKAYELMFNK